MTEIITQIKCKNCGSENIVKFGKYKDTQLYWCKSCQRKFKGDNALFHMKVPPEYISSALSMYYTGSSIKDICDHLNQEYGYYPSKHVVFNWVEKFTSMAVEYFRNVKPKVSDTWICDETVLDLDKHRKIWFFDCIDSETRYLLSSRATFSRTTQDAQMLVDRAIKRAGKEPKVVITDKLASYLDVRYGKNTEHVQGSPFRFKVTGESTSQIERFHGTIKDRTKVMRAFRNLETLHQFMNGYLVYYNYFKPSEALHSKTPAEAAGIDYHIKNWKDLCQLSVTKEMEVQSYNHSLVMKSYTVAKPIKIAKGKHRRAIRPKHIFPQISTVRE